MTKLRRDTVVRLAPELRITRRSGDVSVEAAGGALRGGDELLEVVVAVRVPERVDALVARLAEGRGLDGFAKLAAAVEALASAGVLVDGEGRTLAADRPGRFDGAASHVRMLNDTVRTEALVAAVRAAVRPDDVVLDLGTGTGILALAAAEAGARRVFAVEATGIADAAAAVFAGHPRVTLLRGHSRSLTLAEPATLLVSEIIGAEPLAEGVLETFADARARLLTADARMLPRRLRVFARGVALDPATRRAHRFDPEDVQRWSESYGIALGPLAGLEPRAGYRWLTRRDAAEAFEARTEATQLVDLDLTSAATSFEVEAEAPVVADGDLDAVITWFELELDDERRLTSAPGLEGAATHWSLATWLAPRGLRVERGARVGLRYRHGPAGTQLSLVH